MKISLKLEDIEERIAVLQEKDSTEYLMRGLNKRCLLEDKISYIFSLGKLGKYYDSLPNVDASLFDLLSTIKKYNREKMKIYDQPIDVLFWAAASLSFFSFVAKNLNSFSRSESYVVFIVGLLYFIGSYFFFLNINRKKKINRELVKNGLSTEILKIVAWNKDNQMEKELKEKKYYHFSQCINCGNPIRITDEEIEIDEKLFEQRLTEWHQFLQNYLNEIMGGK